ncbi:hypothetical protein K2173_017838 [Erythroxylum novogranatense]|uniref:Tetrapyrrole biosynthesis uroporphyrinogen III synthase domain-containing protein n=1 Tax=Erythroxylum novogranatense TaxID=1862640 RepID=A0AAV8SLS0_9ROSI|nr:hypothetical protein K2173_017838 [Erythroxylum novogranatense]
MSTTHNPIVAFTTPENYAARLSRLLALNSLTPLWCPTITTKPTPQALVHHLAPNSLTGFSALAFPSRTAISAVTAASLSLPTPLLPPSGDKFIVAALGKDAELINEEFLRRFCGDNEKVRVLVPPTATPADMVRCLGEGFGRRVLCPVPRVVGLTEPPVVPGFIRELEESGWVPVRVDAYETRWSGPKCARTIVERREKGLDAVVFTSIGEVEGLLKSLVELGWDWETVRRVWPRLVVAAHGPVTAAGAESLGVDVDVVNGRFDSFGGVAEAVGFKLRSLKSSCLRKCL